MDHQFGTANEVEELGRNVGKVWFVEQEVAADPVYRQGAGVNLALRVEVAVIVVVGQAPVTHLDAGDFR